MFKGLMRSLGFWFKNDIVVDRDLEHYPPVCGEVVDALFFKAKIAAINRKKGVFIINEDTKEIDIRVLVWSKNNQYWVINYDLFGKIAAKENLKKLKKDKNWRVCYND